MARTRAQENRKIRQDALREQLANQGHLQHVVENLRKIEELKLDTSDESKEGLAKRRNQLQAHNFEINKLKIVNEQRLKLINKYLPDLKSTELTGEGGGAIGVKSFNDMYEDDDSEFNGV